MPCSAWRIIVVVVILQGGLKWPSWITWTKTENVPDVQCSEPNGGGTPTAGRSGVPVSMQGHLGALNKAGEPGEGVVASRASEVLSR